MALTEFTSLEHSWSDTVGSSFFDYAHDYDNNLLYAYVQGNSAVRTYGISTYNLTTKAETAWLDMSGTFETLMTAVSADFDFFNQMHLVPGTDILIGCAQSPKTPPTGDELNICTFDVATGTIIDSTGLLNTAISSTSTLKLSLLVPVTSAGVTKYFYIAPYTRDSTLPYPFSHLLVVEVDTAGNVTLRENLTTGLTTSFFSRWAIGEQREGETDIYFLDANDCTVHKAVIPFVWSVPTPSTVYDLKTQKSAERISGVYWYETSNLLLAFYGTAAGAVNLWGYDLTGSAVEYDVATHDTGPATTLAFNAPTVIHGGDGLAYNDSLSVAASSSETYADPELGITVNQYVICCDVGSLNSVPIAYNHTPSFWFADLRDDMVYFNETTATVLTGSTEHLLKVYYEQNSLSFCEGVSVGPNWQNVCFLNPIERV